MLRKKFSYILSILLLAVLAVWFAFFYYPKSVEIKNTELKLEEMRNDLASANQANVDIEKIEKNLADEESRLEEIRSKFVKKDDLAEITRKIESFAKKYNLKLTDFAPVFEDYFADTTQTIIKALPLAISVQGDYLNIGRFIEDWKDLPFYLTPVGIQIQRNTPTSNVLVATISSKLYSWNN